MEKRIMIACDNSVHSNHAIRYATKIAASGKDVFFTLFHVQPMISQYLVDEAKKNLKSQAELDEIIAKNTETGQNLLENAKEQMVRMGMDEKFIETVTQPRKLGLAGDILDYSHRAAYDAIVMGRRGLSGLQEVVMGSVSANVIEHSKSIPVWLIDGEVDSSRIMLAVDGSESSLKAIDHLALMMVKSPEAKIFFFHVQPKVSDFCPIDFETATNEQIEEIIMKGDKNCIERFFDHALKILKGAGFNENQIEVKVGNTFFNPGKAIIEEAKQGEYGTIVIGRRGINRAFFTGSVSRYVVNQISDMALWIVP
jgi:nucleotide-binding universal stress UspA family protein